MADVDVQVQYTTTERKTRKVKKTSKRRESKDGEVTVTELEQTNTTNTNDDGGEYTKAMNKDWHSGHFCCWQCDESLTGQRYVLRDDHPYCIKCYESVFANGCEECNKIIGIDSKDLSYKDKHWHEACFLCAKCRVSLVDKQFGSKLEKIYCGNCYDAQFASRCDGCGEVFRAGILDDSWPDHPYMVRHLPLLDKESVRLFKKKPGHCQCRSVYRAYITGHNFDF
ncbi:Four and a half LIM domains protein 2 [Papilio xuthus]|uniref:Four and a half LIM domains protein 2 n=1 Tax=Papilio xuthus TaxID=66420 RepID=A0A194QDT4_PAPXU|nr:Four and a half LIM domains protein 2 [Papilio xuthus]